MKVPEKKLDDLVALAEQGLRRGGKLNDAITLIVRTIRQTGFEVEPAEVRTKLLDACAREVLKDLFVQMPKPESYKLH